jgi:tRNA dimethylallyltransferase
MGEKLQADNMNRDAICFIAGPTACGKTLVAARAAMELGGEVVSADSMQVYKHMDIGTAKPTAEEMMGIPHHLIGVLDPKEEFSAAVFKRMADEAIKGVRERGAIPVVCGGSGFYLGALLRGNSFTQTPASKDARDALLRIAEEKGQAFLHQMLKEADPDAAAEIHPNNVKRVCRALEYHQLTGRRISEHNKEERARRPIEGSKLFVLNMPRESLWKRIDDRVDRMYEAGLAQEVGALLRMGYSKDLPAMQALGYKETAAFLEGRATLEEAKDLVKLSTRRFAKRQVTWFKNQTQGIWIDMEKEGVDGAVSIIIKTLAEDGQ